METMFKTNPSDEVVSRMTKKHGKHMKGHGLFGKKGKKASKGGLKNIFSNMKKPKMVADTDMDEM